MYIRAITILITLTAFAIGCYQYIYNHRILFTCSGLYYSDVSLHSLHVVNRSNVVFSVNAANEIFMNVSGTVFHNSNLYHLNREMHYRYSSVDQKKGFYKIYLIKANINLTDTLVNKEANSIVFGGEGHGTLIQVLKLNESTMLVGNPYSPLYSCHVIQ